MRCQYTDTARWVRVQCGHKEEIKMERIPDTVRSHFHDFCQRCPLCDIEGEENIFYASGEPYERQSIATCAHYDFCARMAKAVNDGLVDMRATQKPVSNVDTKQ